MSNSATIEGYDQRCVATGVLGGVACPANNDIRFRFRPRAFMKSGHFVSTRSLGGCSTRIGNIGAIGGGSLVIAPSTAFALPAARMIAISTRIGFPSCRIGRIVNSKAALQGLNTKKDIVGSCGIASRGADKRICRIGRSFALRTKSCILADALDSTIAGRNCSAHGTDSTALACENNKATMGGSALRGINKKIEVGAVAGGGGANRILRHANCLCRDRGRGASNVLVFSIGSCSSFGIQHKDCAAAPRKIVHPSADCRAFHHFCTRTRAPPTSTPGTGPMNCDHIIGRHSFLSTKERRLMFDGVTNRSCSTALTCVPTGCGKQLLGGDVCSTNGVLM